MEKPLQGRTAIVTGASSGIGRAIAERLGRDGATVHLLGRTPAPMEESVRLIRADGGDATGTVLDVRDDTALAAFIDRVADDAGRLDVMVNNAGIGRNGPILDGEASHWREVFDVNVIALLVGCQAAVGAMRRTGSGGHIVNISSTGALKAEFGVYGSTKATVNYLNEGLRDELEGDDIRITAIMPGVTATNFVRNLDEAAVQSIGAMVGIELDHQPGDKLPDEVLEKTQAALESHIAKPEDVADTVAFVVATPRRLNIPELVIRPAQTLDFF
jgi:NAD(P)-dependent dehydrogenase (short-subunit alcohol dehydrogenase family)